jgi:TonB family protein
MKYLISLLFISFGFSMLAQDTTIVYLDHLFAKKKKAKASYYKKLVKTERGVWYTEIYQINGTIHEKGFYKTPNTLIKDGKFETYYPTGDLREKGSYSNDLKVGSWTTFYISGEKDSYGNYDLEGEKDSIWVNLYKNGEIYYIGRYWNGDKNGEWLGYHNDGSKSFIKQYNKTGDLHGAYVEYSKIGLVYDTGFYESGDKVGLWNYFFSTGEPSGVVTYEKGDAINSEYWDRDGTIVNQKNQVVNQDPSFPGGDQKMYAFLGKNMKYPPEARDNNYQGRVYVAFVIEKNGDISDVEILRGVHPSIDEESMRVVREMPKWLPGISQNRKVRVRFNLPIVFKLG